MTTKKKQSVKQAICTTKIWVRAWQAQEGTQCHTNAIEDGCGAVVGWFMRQRAHGFFPSKRIGSGDFMRESLVIVNVWPVHYCAYVHNKYIR